MDVNLLVNSQLLTKRLKSLSTIKYPPFNVVSARKVTFSLVALVKMESPTLVDCKHGLARITSKTLALLSWTLRLPHEMQIKLP